tara:strand:- start:1038 stop:1319 length:282 start_codon:yes stop_codon:yes gene_type:complete
MDKFPHNMGILHDEDNRYIVDLTNHYETELTKLLNEIEVLKDSLGLDKSELVEKVKYTNECKEHWVKRLKNDNKKLRLENRELIKQIQQLKNL